MKILFGTPAAAGMVHVQWHSSVLSNLFMHPDRLANQKQYDLAAYIVEGYSGLGKDRGIIASYAVRNGFDKLFFVDVDQSFKWEQFKAVADSDKPICGGVVGLKRYPMQLNFTPRPEDKDCFEADGGTVFYEGLDRALAKYQQDEIEVKCMGTAFMCIDVKVLLEMIRNKSCPQFVYNCPHEHKPVPCWDFFQSGVVTDPKSGVGLYFGEDWGFCTQANRAGFKSYINGMVRVPHHGSHTYVVGNSLTENNR